MITLRFLRYAPQLHCGTLVFSSRSAAEMCVLAFLRCGYIRGRHAAFLLYAPEVGGVA